MTVECLLDLYWRAQLAATNDTRRRKKQRVPLGGAVSVTDAHLLGPTAQVGNEPCSGDHSLCPSLY